MPVKFEDNTIEVQGKIDDITIAWLYEAAGEIEARTKRNTPVDTGQLKNSWNYVVDESKGEATVGSPLENAIWNEFGTGQYAVNGDGRKTPWGYKDRKDEFHWTHGKKPQRSLQKAFETLKTKLQKSFADKMKGI